MTSPYHLFGVASVPLPFSRLQDAIFHIRSIPCSGPCADNFPRELFILTPRDKVLVFARTPTEWSLALAGPTFRIASSLSIPLTYFKRPA